MRVHLPSASSDSSPSSVRLSPFLTLVRSIILPSPGHLPVQWPVMMSHADRERGQEADDVDEAASGGLGRKLQLSSSSIRFSVGVRKEGN